MPSREELPRFVDPMLARTAPAPMGDGWAVEVKFDGMRLQLRRDGHALCLRSRPGRDCSEEVPELAPITLALGPHRVLLDGELVCLGPDGSPDFASLRRRLRAPADKARRHAERSPATFLAFDVLHLDGARPGSFPTNEGASCCLIWRSRGLAGGRRATSWTRPSGCWLPPGSTASRASSPSGSAAPTCRVHETGPGSSTSSAAPRRSWSAAGHRRSGAGRRACARTRRIGWNPRARRQRPLRTRKRPDR